MAAENSKHLLTILLENVFRMFTNHLPCFDT